ncbi:MAG: tyrosine-type recombinase/integrase [Anaerolineaceae bacterium]|nr:tyrosine-type recombinase/integrase [Anaerolineaceae bacterium]
MSKRSNGEGTIYHKPSGSWRAQITIDGQRVSFTAKTRKECQEWLKRTAGQVDQGLTLEGTRTRFDQVLESWLAIKENNIRLATFEQYRRIIAKYLKPNLGKLTPKDITAANLQGFYTRLQNQGTGKRTIEVVHTVLHGVLKYAQRLGLVSQNWADLVEVPRPEKQEMQVWNESQVSQFLTTNPDSLYRLAFATGMRRGELIALKWEDLDWQTGVIRVSRQVYEPEGGGYRFQEPKTERGRRSIRLGPGMLEALHKQYNQVIPLARAIAGDNWQELSLIFPSGRGTPRNGYEVSKEFKRLETRAGLQAIRFHDIRHTAASLMLAHGEPPVQVAAILGQSLAILLDTYAHFIPGGEERAALLMDQLTSPIMVDLNTLHPVAPKSNQSEGQQAETSQPY